MVRRTTVSFAAAIAVHFVGCSSADTSVALSMGHGDVDTGAGGSGSLAPPTVLGGATSTATQGPAAGANSSATTPMEVPSSAGGTDSQGANVAGTTSTAQTEPPATEPPATEPPATEPPATETPPILEVDGPPRDLYGYWSIGGAIGNCIDFEEYYLFATDSHVEQILDDRDACRPPEEWGTTVAEGTYAIDGRTLSLDLSNGRRRTFDYAIGELGTSTLMYQSVFVPSGDSSWTATTVNEREVDGALASRTAITVDLTFAEPLPTSGSGDCALQVDFQLDQFDVSLPAEEAESHYSGSLTLGGCSYSETERGLEVALDGIVYDEHPTYVNSNVATVLRGSRLWMPPEHSDVLYTSWYVKQDGTPARLQ